ncbi:MAG: three-Cys-motif partner protein TcmP [Phycisphaerales bacterium]|nr:MAG: three-Cys-motif partner protein TcmP [Phycisphaerales bacterium]
MSELPPPKDDGLYIPTVGKQSSDKHYFLMRYINIFTTAITGKWKGLHYIDLFAGAGIEKLRGSEQLQWGSPMIAAKAPKSFTRLHLCELNRQKYQALEKRVGDTRPDSQILNGDANNEVHNITREIPQGTLSLAFLDPYGLELDFETLKVLAAKRADLIIFFPDRLDILRNWKHYYYSDPNSKLDHHLGLGSGWRSVLENAPPNNRAEVLRKFYVERVRQDLGYQHVEHERIPSQGHPLYYLIFCSRSEVGSNFWRKISWNKPGGQRTFHFD